MNSLTDTEKRIFLAAMSREMKVCKQTDSETTGPVNLVSVCRSIESKVKAALWEDRAAQDQATRSNGQIPDTDKISRSALMKAYALLMWKDHNPDDAVNVCDVVNQTLDLIENVPPAPDWTPYWTPCFEKQPDKDGVYHVTVNFNGRSITRDQTFAAGRWLPARTLMVHGQVGEPEVIAWMEKPKPYVSPEMDPLRPM